MKHDKKICVFYLLEREWAHYYIKSFDDYIVGSLTALPGLHSQEKIDYNHFSWFLLDQARRW